MGAMKKRNNPKPQDRDEESDFGPSKTQIKNAMLELQDLGESLLELPDEQLDQLIADEGPLRDALREMRRITSHGARRRHASFVGKLLRDVDTEPLRKAIVVWHAHKARDVRALREIEQWREKIIGSEAGWAEWAKRYPASDSKQTRALVREARQDREMSKVSGASGNGRAFREMFKLIREALLAPKTSSES